MSQSRHNCVYFIWDGHRKSYIGYTSGIAATAREVVLRRVRKHALHLRAGARYTHGFRQCYLLGFFSGFPSARMAMSFEWHSKRRRRMGMMIPTGTHRRWPSFLNTAERHPKFADLGLTLWNHPAPGLHLNAL